MSALRRIGAVLLLLIAGGSGFLTFISWAAATNVGPGGVPSADAQLSIGVFGVTTVFCLLAALGLARSATGGAR